MKRQPDIEDQADVQGNKMRTELLQLTDLLHHG